MSMTEPATATTKSREVFLAQKETSKQWRTQPLKSRIRRLEKIHRWIMSHREPIRQALYQDFRKPAEEVDLSEIYVVLTELKHALKHLHHWSKPQKVDTPLALLGTSSQVIYEPKGVALIISPWNFPFNLTVAPLVSALAAGNTVVLKPSEMTPHCSQLIQDMVSELFDPSEVAVFTGGKETAQELLELPFDHIFFTGSPGVGKKVMTAAARHLSSVTLELGGKSPLILDRTADLRDAAEKIAWGKFINTGQTCIAPDYVLVPQDLQEEFLNELRMAIGRMFDHEGLGIEKSPAYARIINAHHFERLQGLLNDALDRGAILEFGGESDPGERYMEPTVLSNIPEGSDILEEEIFGPILPVITYEQLEEAIEMINAKPKPLALYLFSRSAKNRERIMTATTSGSAAINDCVIQFMNPNLPFGGVNNSGFGKSHGRSGFLAFSNQKSVLKQKVGLTVTKPLFPPYNNLGRKTIDFLLKYL